MGNVVKIKEHGEMTQLHIEILYLLKNQQQKIDSNLQKHIIISLSELSYGKSFC